MRLTVRLLSILSIITAICLLTGCGPMYQTSYEYAPPKSTTGKMCAMQCQQSQSLCQQLCSSRQDQCRSNAQTQAMLNYEEYKNQQIAAGQPVTKTQQDFYSDYQCNNIQCGCSANYNSCFTACGGQIIPHTTCVAFCNKQ